MELSQGCGGVLGPGFGVRGLELGFRAAKRIEGVQSTVCNLFLPTSAAVVARALHVLK